MKYDVIIIGGGLSGLVCGIRLQKAGISCAIVSAGQSALHFSSGTFDLLGRMPDGTEVEEPMKAIGNLDPGHPYSVIGAENVARHASYAREFLKECGIDVSGNPERNTYRITPTGERRPAWLTLNDFTPLPSKDSKIDDKVLIINISGYLDFNTSFIAEALEKQGTSCRIEAICLEEMERLRKNPSEMRSTNIARVMDREEVWNKVVEYIRETAKDEKTVILPAVFGLKDVSVPDRIKEAADRNILFVATMPPSVPGIRTQMLLRSEFEKAGGRFLLGDNVKDAEFDETGQVISIGTQNFGDIRMYADHFVLASGSFFSKGLIADPDRIYEPVFGIDTNASKDRNDWFDMTFWNRQNYLSYGVKTDNRLRAVIDGKPVSNLYAIGSVLGGSNMLHEGCGGGVAIISALHAAENIIKGAEQGGR